MADFIYNNIVLFSAFVILGLMIINLEMKNMALSNAIIGLIESKRNRFSVMTAQFEGASPLQSLSRGYALVTNEDGRNIKSVKKIKTGASVKTKLSDGSFVSRVEKIDSD